MFFQINKHRNRVLTKHDSQYIELIQFIFSPKNISI